MALGPMVTIQPKEHGLLFTALLKETLYTSKPSSPRSFYTLTYQDGSFCVEGMLGDQETFGMRRKTVHQHGVHLQSRLILLWVLSVRHDSYGTTQPCSVCLPNIFFFLPKCFSVRLIDFHFSVRNLSV